MLNMNLTLRYLKDLFTRILPQPHDPRHQHQTRRLRLLPGIVDIR